MPHRTESDVPPGESAIDTLLRDFFRREMPAHLRGLPADHRPTPPPPCPARAARLSIGGLAGLGVAALVLVMALAALVSGPNDEEGRHVAADRLARGPRPIVTALRTRDSDESEPPIVVEVTEPEEQFAVSDGRDAVERPVELDDSPKARPRLVDPDTGMEVDPPEFQVEVYPIEDK